MAHVTIPGTNTVVLAKYLAFQPSLGLLVAVVFQAYYLLLEPIGGVRHSAPRSSSSLFSCPRIIIPMSFR
jgi:hypothetical protein